MTPITITAKISSEKRDKTYHTDSSGYGFGVKSKFYNGFEKGKSYPVLDVKIVSVSNVLVYVYKMFEGDLFYLCPSQKDDDALKSSMLFKGANRLYDYFYTPEELRELKIDAIIE